MGGEAGGCADSGEPSGRAKSAGTSRARGEASDARGGPQRRVRSVCVGRAGRRAASRPAADEAPTARRERILPAGAIPPSSAAPQAPAERAAQAAALPRLTPAPACSGRAGGGACRPSPSQPPAPSQAPPSSPLFDNPSDVDSLLEQLTQSTTPARDQAVSTDLKELIDIGHTAAPPLVNSAAGGGRRRRSTRCSV